MEKQKSKGGCCSCNAGFKKEVDQIVGEVEGYTKTDHDKKRKELNDAFAEKKDKK